MKYLLIILFLLSSSLLHAQEWEYLTVGIFDELYEKSMNLLGKNGWDLVSSRRAIVGEGESRKIVSEMIFKRQKITQNSKFMSKSDTQEMVMELHKNYVAEKKAEQDKKIKEIQAAQAKLKKDFEEAKKRRSEEINRKLEKAKNFAHEYFKIITTDTTIISVTEFEITARIENISHDVIKRATVKCSLLSKDGEQFKTSFFIVKDLAPREIRINKFYFPTTIHFIGVVKYEIHGLELK